jgi:hypothetical protein
MDAPDPLLDEEPDFLGDQYAAHRQVLTDASIAADAINGILRQSWQAERLRRHHDWEAARMEVLR